MQNEKKQKKNAGYRKKFIKTYKNVILQRNS